VVPRSFELKDVLAHVNRFHPLPLADDLPATAVSRACLGRRESTLTVHQNGARPRHNLGRAVGIADDVQSPTGGLCLASMAMCEVTRILGKIESGDLAESSVYGSLADGVGKAKEFR
jgi:hypothetical protein